MRRSILRGILPTIVGGAGIAFCYAVHRGLKSLEFELDFGISQEAIMPRWVRQDIVRTMPNDWVPFKDRFETFVAIPEQFRDTNVDVVLDKNTRTLQILADNTVVANVPAPNQLTEPEHIQCNRGGGYLTIRVSRPAFLQDI